MQALNCKKFRGGAGGTSLLPMGRGHHPLADIMRSAPLLHVFLASSFGSSIVNGSSPPSYSVPAAVQYDCSIVSVRMSLPRDEWCNSRVTDDCSSWYISWYAVDPGMVSACYVSVNSRGMLVCRGSPRFACSPPPPPLLQSPPRSPRPSPPSSPMQQAPRSTPPPLLPSPLPPPPLLPPSYCDESLVTTLTRRSNLSEVPSTESNTTTVGAVWCYMLDDSHPTVLALRAHGMDGVVVGGR